MAKNYRVRGPDNKFYKITVPDGATIEQAQEFFKKEWPRILVENDAITKGAKDPTAGMSSIDKVRAGWGKAVTDLARGAKQTLGFESKENIKESQRIDRPLMKHPEAKAGNIAGNLVTLAPTALIPGANTATGAAALGGMIGLTTPVGEGNVAAEKAKLAGIGAVTGGATQKLMNVAGARLSPSTSQDVNNKSRILKESIDSGFVVPPAQARPTLTNKLLEGWAGGGQTARHASERNQAVTNSLVKKALGAADDLDGLGAVNAAKKKAGGMYNQLKGLGSMDVDDTFRKSITDATGSYQKTKAAFKSSKNPEIDTLLKDLSKNKFDIDTVVDKVAELRREAGTNFRSLEGKKVSLARVQDKVAKALEGLIERHLEKTGNQAKLTAFREGRKLYAKSITAEKALNPVTGDFAAQKIAKDLQKQKPLSGELKQIGEFGSQFPNAAQTIRGSVLPINPLETSGLGAAATLTGNPSTLAWWLGRPAVRQGLLSRPYQKHMLNPSQGMLAQGAEEVATDPTIQYLLRALGPTLLTEPE